MSDTIQAEHFTGAIYMLLDEAFDNVHGIFLDKGTSMFETLRGVTAEEASIPVGGRCATLAAQVKHVAFYIDLLVEQVRTQVYEPADWGKIWRETRGVSAEEWQAIQDDLRRSYDDLKALVADTREWPDVRTVGGAIGVVVHTAYHLGEIRQALCTLKP